MAERLSNLGYLALGKETTKGTAVIPSVYAQLYSESLMTNVALVDDTPIMGNKAARYRTLLGMRSHGGELSILAEPNTAAHIMNMLLTLGSTSGSNPYTHPFTLSASADPKAYTIDIAKGQVVARFMGAEISELGIEFDDNKMLFKAKVHALKSFIVRELASTPTGSNPYTAVFTTAYDDSPTDGLVVGDTVRILKANGTTIDFAVASIAGVTSITTTTDITSAAAGDLFFIRPATPSFTVRDPFLWAKSEFRFGVDASTALSATQTRVEDGSAFTLMHKFEKDEGAQRSGDFDPAALVRTQGDAEINIKKYFDTPEDMNRFLTNQKRAMVFRAFSEGSTYEFRVTFNNIKIQENPTNLESGSILYSEPKFVPMYDTSDAQVFDVKVLNALSTI